MFPGGFFAKMFFAGGYFPPSDGGTGPLPDGDGSGINTYRRRRRS